MADRIATGDNTADRKRLNKNVMYKLINRGE